MKFSTGIGVASTLTLALAGASQAYAKASAPSGNLNLRIDGYEVLAPTVNSPAQYTVTGLGQVIGNSSGTLDGVLTYTLVDVSAATQDTCSDTVSGTITPPTGNFSQAGGSFTASLTLTETSGGGECESSTIALLCNRTLLHHDFVDDLNAGTYHCIATSVTPNDSSPIPASLTVRIGSVEGANAPND
ncbi:MAG TPA: hypothetical protein VMF50_13295 [Candidatus Binataceae bacterium]|nr:hypothetical protein [Candidatus Binataceae bacterium]